MAPTEMRVDPITLSVIWNRLDSLCDEAGERVIFAAQSFVMGNARDLGTTFLDEKGRFVSVSAYLPIHVFGADRQIQAILEKFGRAFKPGDQSSQMTRSYVAAGHLPDWIFVRPAFYKDELVGFFYLRGHMADTGGFQPGGYAAGAFDIIAEGTEHPANQVSGWWQGERASERASVPEPTEPSAEPHGHIFYRRSSAGLL